MQLDKFTDYALRMLIALAVTPAPKLPTSEIARLYGVSDHHLSKVASKLVHGGFVLSDRGGGGGLRLARPADEISIGAVVRAIKQDEAVVECLGTDKSCQILPACGLRGPLQAAREAFFAALDDVMLADVTQDQTGLAHLLAQIPVDAPLKVGR
jgi:Rrf2 family nitric oxide-sensitive transcriptional repressor